jgi:hypothetical protein
VSLRRGFLAEEASSELSNRPFSIALPSARPKALYSGSKVAMNQGSIAD